MVFFIFIIPLFVLTLVAVVFYFATLLKMGRSRAYKSYLLLVLILKLGTDELTGLSVVWKCPCFGGRWFSRRGHTTRVPRDNQRGRQLSRAIGLRAASEPAERREVDGFATKRGFRPLLTGRGTPNQGPRHRSRFRGYGVPKGPISSKQRQQQGGKRERPRH